MSGKTAVSSQIRGQIRYISGRQRSAVNKRVSGHTNEQFKQIDEQIGGQTSRQINVQISIETSVDTPDGSVDK